MKQAYLVKNLVLVSQICFKMLAATVLHIVSQESHDGHAWNFLFPVCTHAYMCKVTGLVKLVTSVTNWRSTLIILTIPCMFMMMMVMTSNPLSMYKQCFILLVKSNNGSIGGVWDWEVLL